MSIYLHIGVGKTGTSSLQTFLAQFRPEIDAQGYHVIRTGCDAQIAAHHLLALGFGFSKQDNDDLSLEIFNALKQEISKHQDKKIIISSELLHSQVTDKKLENLHRALQDAEVKVILYVRRQDEWIDSAFRQFAEMNNVHSIEQLIDRVIKNRAIDYKWQVDMWEKYFGRGNVILRVYESGSLKRDTVADFSEVIGLTLSSEMKAFNYDGNPSIAPAEAEILRIINCISKDRKKTRDAVLKVLREDQTIEHSKYHYMTPESRSNIRAFYARGNAELASKYFGRTDGVLFVDSS